MPISQSPLIRVLIGLNKHRNAALISTIGSIAIFSISLLTISLTSQQTLTAYTMALTVTLSLVNGVFIPVYACKRLNIALTNYITTVFLRVTVLCSISVILLIFSKYFIQNTVLDILFGSSIYLIGTLILYWFYLIDVEVKEKVSTKAINTWSKITSKKQ